MNRKAVHGCDDEENEPRFRHHDARVQDRTGLDGQQECSPGADARMTEPTPYQKDKKTGADTQPALNEGHCGGLKADYSIDRGQVERIEGSAKHFIKKGPLRGDDATDAAYRMVLGARR